MRRAGVMMLAVVGLVFCAVPAARAQDAGNVYDAFRKYDLNGDGVIDLHEAVKAGLVKQPVKAPERPAPPPKAEVPKTDRPVARPDRPAAKPEREAARPERKPEPPARPEARRDPPRAGVPWMGRGPGMGIGRGPWSGMRRGVQRGRPERPLGGPLVCPRCREMMARCPECRKLREGARGGAVGRPGAALRERMRAWLDREGAKDPARPGAARPDVRRPEGPRPPERPGLGRPGAADPAARPAPGPGRGPWRGGMMGPRP